MLIADVDAKRFTLMKTGLVVQADGCVLSIAGSPINAGPAGNAGAAIFDSTNGPAGQDPDLMVGQGNILILQNNQNAQVLSKSGDFYVHPNDDHNGGTLTFTFCEPADASTIDLIDIDDANGPGIPDGASVVLTDVDGFTHTITVPDGWTGDTRRYPNTYKHARAEN